MEMGERSSDEVPVVELEISEDNTVVGDVLLDHEDHEARENWRRLVRKLSLKRSKSKKKKEASSEEKKTDLEDVSTDEDEIPEDWQPDFMPSFSSIPDVVPKTSMDMNEEEELLALSRMRSKRR